MRKTQAGIVALTILLAVCGGRWWRAHRALNEPGAIAAWGEIQRDRILELCEVAMDPHAVKLWLAVGRDPNGHDCARWAQRPSAFSLAILKPLGLCTQRNADGMPFMRATNWWYSPDAAEAIRLMIEAGVDVNEAAPDGGLPLTNAVTWANEVVVRMLLEAGADPLRRAPHDVSAVGAYENALGRARRLAASTNAAPAKKRIAAMMEEAAAARAGARGTDPPGRGRE